MAEFTRTFPPIPPQTTPFLGPDGRTLAKEWAEYFTLQRNVSELLRAQFNVLDAQITALDSGFTDRVLAILVDQGLI